MRKHTLMKTFPLVAFLLSCTPAEEKAPKKPSVIVSIMPQAYFASRIAGERIDVITMVGRGANPHSYEPGPTQMAQISTAIAWFTTGIEFERALVPRIRALYPQLKIVDANEHAVFRHVQAHAHHAGHTDGCAEENNRDPHTWLGQQGALAQAAAMRDTLVALDPAHGAEFKSNYDRFAADVNRVFAGLEKDLAPLRGQTVFVYHPAFGYFLDRFGLIQEAVETGGKEPTQKAIAALVEEARADGVKVIFVQKQFPATTAQTVAEAIGGVVVEMDDLSFDWLENLEAMGRSIRGALR